MPGFAKKGEKSPGIRAYKAPRGANSKNLRMNSRRLGQMTSQKNCTKNLPRSLLSELLSGSGENLYYASQRTPLHHSRWFLYYQRDPG
jgi:hypothetical protein